MKFSLTHSKSRTTHLRTLHELSYRHGALAIRQGRDADDHMRAWDRLILDYRRDVFYRGYFLGMFALAVASLLDDFIMSFFR